MCMIMSEDEKEPELEEVEKPLENTEDSLEAEESEEISEFDDEQEEVEFDLEDQVEEFRRQIEEDPDNCVNYYNLGEALSELGQLDEARESFEQALLLDTTEEFSAIIHFGIGNLYYHQLMSGIQSTVVKSSVGLHSAYKVGEQITSVHDDDYAIPLREFEAAVQDIPNLKADEEIVFIFLWAE